MPLYRLERIIGRHGVAIAREMAAAFDAAGPGRPLLVVGGPRFDPSVAASLGVDKIFGKGTTPSEVASYLAHALTPTDVSPATSGREVGANA